MKPFQVGLMKESEIEEFQQFKRELSVERKENLSNAKALMILTREARERRAWEITPSISLNKDM